MFTVLALAIECVHRSNIWRSETIFLWEINLVYVQISFIGWFLQHGHHEHTLQQPFTACVACKSKCLFQLFLPPIVGGTKARKGVSSCNLESQNCLSLRVLSTVFTIKEIKLCSESKSVTELVSHGCFIFCANLSTYGEITVLNLSSQTVLPLYCVIPENTHTSPMEGFLVLAIYLSQFCRQLFGKCKWQPHLRLKQCKPSDSKPS